MEDKIKPATGEPYGLAGQMQQAFEQIGATMMSKDWAARLLAYVYVCGGGNEAVTLHPGLNAAIQIAQQIGNVYGGNVPNREVIIPMNQYIKQLEEAIQVYGMFDHNRGEAAALGEIVPWVGEIYKKYNLDAVGKDKTK